MMKKLLCVFMAGLMLTACANNEDIKASRGAKSSRVTRAEIDQYNKQRENEVIEAETQARKAEGYSEAVRQGSSAIQSGVDAVRSIMGIFGR